MGNDMSLLLSINLTIIYIGFLFITPKFKKEYYDTFFNQQLTITLAAPIVEECLFRGIILQVLLSYLALVCPSTIIFPFLNLSIAAFCAILGSSLLFGLAHISNAEDQNHLQVLCTFLLGLFFGYLYLQFGLFTAIGSHIFNNTLACIIFYSQLEIVQAQGFYAPGYS